MIRSRKLLGLLLLAAAPTPAQAADTVLTPASDTAAITAYDGHVVLSKRDPSTNRWALVRWHAGVVDVLPVAQRSVPFDADAGSDASGRPVVVFSRCRQDPAMPTGLAPAPDWQTARGCDLYELSLTGAPAVHKIAIASSRTKSETTPSIWRGAVAFVRHADGGAVPRVHYLPRDARRVRTLGGGAVQTCGSMCAFSQVHDGVDQLDLGPSRATILWRMTGGSVYGTGVAWELRAAPLKGGRSTLLDSGLISGTCGFRLPSGATAARGPITYLDANAKCDVTTTRLATVDPVTGARRSASTPDGLAVGAVRDGATIYWLRASSTAGDVPIPGAAACGFASARCELVASSLPTDVREASRRQGTPADVDLVRSRFGYRWVRGPAGTRLLRPPARMPCALSSQPVDVYVSARWSRGRHAVRVLRSIPRRATRQVAGLQTRSFPDGLHSLTKLARCGDRMRLTYVVKTGRTTRRVSFDVVRGRAPR